MTNILEEAFNTIEAFFNTAFDNGYLTIAVFVSIFILIYILFFL
jgi:hypothetical protein